MSVPITINSVEYLAEEITVAEANRQPTRVVVTNLMDTAGKIIESSPGIHAEASISYAGKTLSLLVLKWNFELAGEQYVNSVELSPPGLYTLSRLPYFQRWMSRPGDSPASLERTGFVVLNQAEDGENITVAEQLQDVFQAAKTLYPTSPGVNITGGAWGGIRLPVAEDRNVTCLQALMTSLRYFPKVFVRDSDGASGVVIANSGSAWGAQPSQFLRDRTTDDDSQINRVNVEYVLNSQKDDAPWFALRKESAGSGSPLATLDATFRYEGSRASMSKATVDIKTAEIPDLYNKDFWRELAPSFFENVADADITISSPSRSGESDAASYPRRAVETSLPEIESVEPPLRVRVEQFTCKASVKRKDGGNLLSHETDVPLSSPVITTNAESKRYSWITGMSLDTGDPVPEGLAQQLLYNAPDSGSVSVSFFLLDPANPSPPEIGATFRGYPCQSTLTSLAMNTCTASFASAPALDMKSLAELMNNFRRRGSASYTKKTRRTGEIDTGD